MASALQDDPFRQAGTAPGRSPRWTLSRGGIINVYQYGEETLEFGGGRLLLRGVNGSGKSTAMNMLLPFLLDGDVRRIDAAGEQTGVLQSWMLSGRDESAPQPVGYLWLEAVKDGEYLSFGCGIRASRATETVSTWWFITSRRPGIDLQLVEGRVPVNRDTLRTLIAPAPLYSQEERGAYRTELARRLFGGADIEEHLHLLRIVRNPRIGDRLDTELPQYLQNALPRLSEGALDDAAQPLEDLEEHRRNVTELKGTAEALEAIHSTYRAYARTELHRHAELTSKSVSAFHAASREEEREHEAHTEAAGRQRSFQEEKRSLDGRIERLQAEITALKDSDAYKSGADLNDLRALVQRLLRTVQDNEHDVLKSQDTTRRAAEQTRGAHGEAHSAHHGLGQVLSNLGAAAQTCRLAARPPAIPPLPPHPDSPPDLPLAPAAPVDTAGPERVLAQLADCTRQRTGEVGTVEAAVRAIEPAERALREAERDEERARGAHEEAGNRHAAAVRTFQAGVTQWQADAGGWLERLQQHHLGHGLPRVERPGAVERAIDELLAGHRLTPALEGLITPTIEHHESRRADTRSALNSQGEVVADLEAKAAELAAKQVPDPPLLSWQQRAVPCLAELVDFEEGLAPAARAGLEAALESSGLLAAEVRPDGTLVLTSGQLLLTAGGQAEAPLGALLRPDLPKGTPAAVRTGLTRILAGISTDLTSDADTVVSVAGEFRVGRVRGCFEKPAAEHIGVSARRQALERARAEAARLLTEARAEHEHLAVSLKEAEAALAAAQALRHTIPSDQDLLACLWARNEAERALERALEQLEASQAAVEEAAGRHAAAVSQARETASRLLLPHVLAELAAIREDLRQILADCGQARRELGLLKQAVERWRHRGEDWQRACAAEELAQERLRVARLELLPEQARLDTLDAKIGAAYEQVVAEINRSQGLLQQSREALQACENALTMAVGDVARTQEKWQAATAARVRLDAACVETLGVLRRVLVSPGLIEAAIDPPDGADMPALLKSEVDFPVVEDSVTGARQLAEAIRTRVLRAAEPVSAESVRASIRARRDTIGAGWDAEGRQPDPALPLYVEVTSTDSHTAPLPTAARAVRERLTRMENLLSAKQQQALSNLLQGLVAREIADRMHAASQMIDRMNGRLATITTSHGIGVRLQWKLRDDLDPVLAPTIALLAKMPDLRTAEEDQRLATALGERISEARREAPGTPYRELIARVLDYREWHRMKIHVLRPGKDPELLTRRTALSEGEKKMVTYLPSFAAVAASCDSMAAQAPDVLRFVLLDDAFNKVSEDNHGKLFGLLIELDLDFILTSERLWGTYDTVPDLAITEVIRDAEHQAIVLEHWRWRGRHLELVQ